LAIEPEEDPESILKKKLIAMIDKGVNDLKALQPVKPKASNALLHHADAASERRLIVSEFFKKHSDDDNTVIVVYCPSFCREMRKWIDECFHVPMIVVAPLHYNQNDTKTMEIIQQMVKLMPQKLYIAKSDHG